MRIVEVIVAAVFALGGVWSLVTWSRRRFESTDAVDHLLFALFVTGRAGLWFAFAGFFAIYATVDAPGRPGLDAVEPYRWYLVVPLVLGGFQLVGGWFLGRRTPRDRWPARSGDATDDGVG